MLGEQVGESRGKRTARRVLSVDGGFKVEVSFEERGKLLGNEGFGIGTYWSANRPDGTLYGEGQGVFVTAAGDTATWKGGGVGMLAGDGSVAYRGAIYYTSASPKLSRLNSVACVFEFGADPEGNVSSKLWEWK